MESYSLKKIILFTALDEQYEEQIHPTQFDINWWVFQRTLGRCKDLLTDNGKESFNEF